MKTIAYLAVYNRLKEMIENHVYKVGDMLPPEHALEKMFQVSRITVRRAVKLLIDDGYVIIKPGKGTMVVNRTARQRLNYVSSFTEALKNKGFDIQLNDCSIEVIDPTQEVAEKLKISEKEKVVCIKRAVYANSDPFALITNYIPYSMVPGLEHDVGHFVSLYSFLEYKFNYTIDTATDTISAINATKELAEKLKLEEGAALLINVRTSFKESVPVEYAITIVDSRQFSYSVNMVGRNLSN